MGMLFFEWAKQVNEIIKFVINLPKIIERAKKIQKIILILIKLVHKI